jgi:Uma2 family endonuclease
MAARPLPTPLVTEADYLAADRAAEERSNYLDGQVWAMAGESSAHGDILVNLVGLVHAQLEGKSCRARTSNTRVRSGPAGPRPFNSTSGLYSYPDVIVVCGEPQYLDGHKDVVTNPTVVIEVLSPSTEAFDRGEKLLRFTRWNATLTDYLLVSQVEPRVERYQRQSDGNWLHIRHEGLASECVLEGIGVRLPLARVYARVPLPDAG